MHVWVWVSRPDASKQFVADNYWIPCTLSVVYVSFVFGMQSYLKEKDLADKKAWVKAKRAAGENVKETDAPTWATREPAWVKVLLFTWNMILGVFSMVGTPLPLSVFTVVPVWSFSLSFFFFFFFFFFFCFPPPVYCG